MRRADADYREGALALNRNDLETARTKQAVAQDSRNAQLHDELGSLYAMEKNWIPAEQQFPEAVTLKEDSASAQVWKAWRAPQ